MIRVVLGGDGLDGFDAGEFTDHYVKLQIPPAGAGYEPPFDVDEVKAGSPREQWPRVRTYTVQEWDAARGELTIDFVVHGDTGVAGPWAARAQPGMLLQFQGPGGAYTPDPTAAWHLMLGDASVLPAISASLRRIPAGVPVHVLVEVEGPQEQRELDSPGELEATWVPTAGAGEPPARALSAALAALIFPPGRVHCFVHGEASSVRAIRRHLLVDRGLDRDGMSVSGYWKRERTEEGWREDKPEWNRLIEADVADAAGDPV
jgi:NADPH-dependent ferric siderophore reductase